MRTAISRSVWFGILGAVGITAAIAACSDTSGRGGLFGSLTQGPTAREPLPPGADPIEGLDPEQLKALSSAPAFDSSSGVLTITMAPGELGMVSLRSLDNAIIVNGVQAVDTVPSTPVPATSTNVVSIVVVESALDAGVDASTLTTEFIVDYTNGVFAKGLSGGTGGIGVTFSGAEPTLLGVKGTSGADNMTFGSTAANVNGDGYADITWGSSANGGVGTFVVSMGAGDDTFYAGGDSTTGGARFNNDAPPNPVTGYAAGVFVYGGGGNDTFAQGATPTPYETIYGGGQAGDTVDYSQRTTGVDVTLSVPGIPSTVSGNCAAPSADAAADASLPTGVGCATDEFDDIKNDVFVVNGGSGDDFLTASPTAIIAVVAGSSDAGTDSGADAGDAGRADAGDAGRADSGADAGDAGRADAGDAGRADAGSDAGSDAGPPAAQAGSSVVFNGGAGNDTLTPYGGPFVMNGGAGNDTFLMGADGDPHGAGRLNGGSGVDYADFGQRTAALKITMDGTTKSGTTSSGVVTENLIISADIENVHGGAGADNITGNALDNVINGGPGADTMTGGGGNDTVDYSDATGPVWAALDGVAHSGASSTITRSYGTSGAAYTDGTCTITSSDEGDTIMPDITNLVGSQGDDCLFGQPTGSACPGMTCQNNLTGGPGSDMLFGYDDDDVLEGSGGAGGDGASDSNYLDCGGGYGNTGHNLGVVPPGYKARCQF